MENGELSAIVCATTWIAIFRGRSGGRGAAVRECEGTTTHQQDRTGAPDVGPSNGQDRRPRATHHRGWDIQRAQSVVEADRVDEMLECVQSLYETAAHQFLRDGDCEMELDAARTSLTAILEKAISTVEELKEKAKKQEEARAKEEAEDNDTDPELTLYKPPWTEHLDAISNQMAPTSVSQTLDDMKIRATMSAPVLPTTTDPGLPTAGMTIEVDDAGEDHDLADLDISQFRLNNAPYLRG